MILPARNNLLGISLAYYTFIVEQIFLPLGVA